MDAATLKAVLKNAIQTGGQILIVSEPGTGKSEIVQETAKELNVPIAVFHPIVEEPTDVKGFPWCYTVNGQPRAQFVTYGEMARLLNPPGRLVAFLDDLGHASEDMQAAWTQPIWARNLNGHPISPNVVFIGATNDVTHKAGVYGMIEPLKSRFDSIIRYKPTIDDWVDWAWKHNMPDELIAFNRFRPELMFQFKPTKELTNSPCPRNVASLGKILTSNYPPDAIYELGEGAVGSGYMTEFMAYRELYAAMPDPLKVLADPDNAELPEEPGIMYALTTALARHASAKTMVNLVKLADRLMASSLSEFAVLLMKDVRSATPNALRIPEYRNWALKASNLLLYQE